MVDDKGIVLQNVERLGIETITNVRTDELALHILPTVMGLLWGRLIGEVGRLNCVVVSYSRVYLMAFCVSEYLVVITFEPKAMPRVVRRLESAFGTLLPGVPDKDAGNR